MTQKLTEEQQRTAHKIIVANRGDCICLKCINCPNSIYNSGDYCFSSRYTRKHFDPAFNAESLRRSQAWLDAHITDAEILAETPREFCLRMVRTEGKGECIAGIKHNSNFCKTCFISVDEKYCFDCQCFERAKAYLAQHTATTQEPAKRRPTLVKSRRKK